MQKPNIGVPLRRLEGAEKVTGRTRYAGDLSLPGMLHARLVLSPYAHARIVHIPKEGLGVPGTQVVTAEDLPPSPEDAHAPLLAREETCFCGQPVAVVLAESEAAAEDAAEMLRARILYEELPAALDPLEAMRPGSPIVRPRRRGETGETQAHATIDVQEGGGPEAPNITAHVHFSRGDVTAGFAEADVVREETFRTPIVHQSYLEPHAAIASYDPFTGVLTLWASVQGQFYVRSEVSRRLGLPQTKVRVIPMPVGGAFGAKILHLEPLVAALALVTRRPVRLVLSRMEEFLAGTPAPQAVITGKVGARRDGTLVALQARLVFDSGAEPGTPLNVAALLLGGYYRFPHLEIEGFEVLTHKAPVGAYRGPGAVQATFAIESLVDAVARALDLDPVEFRLRNIVQEGDPMPNGKPWPRIGLRECLEALRNHVLWQERRKEPHQGYGLAIGGWPGGIEPASACVRANPDGTFHVLVGAVDLTGTATAFAQIAAEVLGVPVEQIQVITGDTDQSPYAGMSAGSKTLYTVGAAVKQAAEEARRQLLTVASDQLEAAIEDLEIVDGHVQVKGVPGKALPISHLAKLTMQFGAKYPPIFGRGESSITRQSPGFAAHLAKVEVDPETGRVGVLEYLAVQDVGRAINPAEVQGQIHGGVAQGIGWALLEEVRYDSQGTLLTTTFSDYAIPKAADVPQIHTVLVEVPSPFGPFGAKGVGEPPVIPVAAAICNAIADAVGVRVTTLPVTPERLHQALESSGKSP
ncbi:MAG: xanthine dehydrogenase family protein molybdopterin-binding subunit [Armatimonadota bacterium]|nr:xanthine dehydrogenase family protein molybdopterin-binding subunit [Armatimonadota bacterium]MDR5703043.1 xanthine dehydrogenase family protein molybdopterin-binding subunit [Armatimonadota bacterium]